MHVPSAGTGGSGAPAGPGVSADPDNPDTGDTVDVPVRLHGLVYLDEGEQVTVGRPDIDSYGMFPPDGAALLRRLAEGVPPAAAARWYESTYGESVDMTEFMAILRELEFVAEADDTTGPAPAVRWQRLGAAVFSPVAWVCYALLLGGCTLLLLREPDLRPHYANLFFSPYVTVIELVLFVGQLPALLFHEGFHALAGRRLGLRSRLSLGRRLYYIVFETSLDGLVAVPRNRRYLPMLAGMLADALLFAALIVVAHMTREPGGGLSTVGGVCLALAFTTLLRFVWQFYFYLQTDLYHVACTTLGCVDLQKAARRTLRNRANRLLRRTDRLLDDTTWHPRDRQVARWYSWLLVAGYTVAIATLVLAVIPTVVRFFDEVFGRLDGTASTGELTDFVVFLALTLLQFAVFVLVVMRDRRRRTPELEHLLD